MHEYDATNIGNDTDDCRLDELEHAFDSSFGLRSDQPEPYKAGRSTGFEPFDER